MKITTVSKCRKAQKNCGRCSATVPAGSSYRWIKSRYGPKQVRCMKADCDFRGSELVSNETISAALQMSEDASESLDAATTLDDIIGTLDCLADQVEEISTEAEEKANNVEEHFSGSALADELRERAEAIEAWKSAIEEARDEVSDPDEFTSEDCDLCDGSGRIDQGAHDPMLNWVKSAPQICSRIGCVDGIVMIDEDVVLAKATEIADTAIDSLEI